MDLGLVGSHVVVAGASRGLGFAIVRYLLEEGADPNHVNKLGESALHQAADNNKVNVAKLLLKYGADPNLQQNGKK